MAFDDPVARLAEAREHAEVQRRKLRHRADVTRESLTPSALKDRARFKTAKAVRRTEADVRRVVRDNRLPIAAAVVGSLAFIFRKQIASGARSAAAATGPIMADIIARIAAASEAERSPVERAQAVARDAASAVQSAASEAKSRADAVAEAARARLKQVYSGKGR